MAATVPFRVTDLIHKYGWDAVNRLSALGIQNLAEAQVLFVDSGATNTLDADDGYHGHTMETPLATIDYAVGLCTASEQSIIIVAPGHAETEAAAAALVTCDIAGVKIIGMGEGTLRPTITLSTDTGAVAFSVTAANVVISNIKILVTKDAVASAISVAGASCKLVDIEVSDNASTTEAAIGILTTTAADDLTVERYIHNGFLAGDACTEAIRLVGVSRGVIKDCWFRGKFSTAAIQMVTTACAGIVVRGCVFENGTTALTTDIVDNATSKWSAIDCFDVVGGYGFGGGSGSALASDDVSSVISQVNKIDAVTLDTTPVAASLATFVAGGAGGQGTQLPTSTSLYDTTKNVSTVGVTGAPVASTLADTLHKDGSFTFDNTTDSLEAIRDRLDSLAASLPTQFMGTAETNADTSTIISAELSGYGNGFFNTDWVAVVILAAGASEGEIRDITDYVSATGTFTVGSAFTAAVTAGDEVLIARREKFLDDMVSLKAAPATGSLATFVASGGTALGQPLPASTSLVDIIGDFTGPHGGTAYDDNIFAAIKKLSTYIADGDGDFATGTALPTNKSLYDTVKYLGFLTTGVAADADLTAMAVDQSLLSHIMTKGANTSDFQASTDSLEAIADAVAVVDASVDAGVPQLVTKAIADMTGFDTAAVFTVTGDVMVQVFGVVGATAITSTSGTTTLSVGTTQAAQGIIADSTVDNTQFDATDVWVDATPANDVAALAAQNWHIVGGGADIVLSRSVDDLTAGALTLYCRWIPISSGATVVAVV